jgi:uncharacterized protein involved in exopolysaccharide biosynthesis
MKFDNLKKIIEERFGTDRPADIAKELNVTPQVVNNWKVRNQVPYKYVKLIRKKIENLDKQVSNNDVAESLYAALGNVSEKKVAELSISEIIILFYKQAKENLMLLICVPIIFMILSVIYLKFFVVPVYTTTATLLPISASSKSGINSIASQYGISLGPSSNEYGLSSAEMFPDIIQSRSLARSIINDKFFTDEHNSEVPLLQILLEEKNEDYVYTHRDTSNAIDILSKKINVRRKDRSSPLLILSVQAFEPQLSCDLTNAVIAKLKEMASKFKISRVLEKKTFIENRISQTEGLLTKAEDNIKVFREKNRNIFNSPALLLQESRLIRETDIQMQVYGTLKSEYEMVRIEEVEKNSMLQVLDRAEPPKFKTSPLIRRLALLWAFIGLLITSISIYSFQYFKIIRDEFKDIEKR